MNPSGRRRKITPSEWWVRRIETLRGQSQEASQLFQKTKKAYSCKSWAILKLAILAYYADIYTAIIKAHFDKAYYIDLFAGPGLDRISDLNNLIVFGSPLIADRVPRKKFDELILFEKKEKYAEALRRLLLNATVKNKDVNSPEFKAMTKARLEAGSVHFLAFVDPEGLEIEWETLQHLFNLTGDLIINYQSTGVSRSALKENKTSAEIETLQRFFGTDEWKACENEDALFELYLEKIREHREVTIPIKVKSPYRFYYYMIVAVRKTRGSQHWVSAIEETKEKIEAIKPEDLENIIRRLSGGQEKLAIET